jgi:hypothetical protein
MVTLSLSGILATGMTASGCATPWFETQKKADAPAAPLKPSDLRQATVTYINNLCKLPKDQRDPTLRELNEALLPNHAAISCGRAGDL